MLRASLVLVSLLACSSFADECALDARAIAPQFSSKLPKGVKLVSTKKDKRKVKQVLKLADGIETTVEFGGCERVQYSFSIKGAGLNTKTVGAEAVAVARRVLPTLPMGKDAMAEPKVLLSALEDGSFTSLPATLSCGSGSCRVELVPDPSAKKKPAAKEPPPAKKGEKKEDEKPADEPEVPALLVLSYDAAI
ncbi:MAG: hypothetical protein JNM69_31770 [Archangium sp.]|nr:hypothetical protein [Archangium sp.]